MLLNIFLHWEKMVELTLSLENVFGADDVERSKSGDAGHFDDAVDRDVDVEFDVAEESTLFFD